MGRQTPKRCYHFIHIAASLAAIASAFAFTTHAHAEAVIGTYAEPNILVADGTTIYTAWVYADNTGLEGQPTWGTQHDFFLPPYATLIPGGQGIAYGTPDPSRDFFADSPMIFETISPPNEVTG